MRVTATTVLCSIAAFVVLVALPHASASCICHLAIGCFRSRQHTGQNNAAAVVESEVIFHFCPSTPLGQTPGVLRLRKVACVSV